MNPEGFRSSRPAPRVANRDNAKRILFAILSAHPMTAVPLLERVRTGQIDGRSYGHCNDAEGARCIYGWVWRLAGGAPSSLYELPEIAGIGGGNDLEIMVFNVKRGDTPATSGTLREIAVWIEEWFDENPELAAQSDLSDVLNAHPLTIPELRRDIENDEIDGDTYCSCPLGIIAGEVGESKIDFIHDRRTRLYGEHIRGDGSPRYTPLEAFVDELNEGEEDPRLQTLTDWIDEIEETRDARIDAEREAV